MNLVNKYILKIKREFLKRDSKKLSKIINKYNVKLFINDKDNLLFDIKSDDNLKHLLSQNSYLDGDISNILNSFNGHDFNTCIDVGANFGLSSMLMARYSKKVFAFEPESTNYSRLNELVKINNFSNINCYPMAVSEKEGIMDLFIAKASSHHSLGVAHEGQSQGNIRKVEVTTLDFFCKSNNIIEVDCLKVDVEGFEKEVFFGARQLFKDKKIKNLVFEISTGVLDRLNREPFEIINFLEKNEYSINDVRGNKISSDTPLKYFDGQDLLATPIY